MPELAESDQALVDAIMQSVNAGFEQVDQRISEIQAKMDQHEKRI